MHIVICSAHCSHIYATMGGKTKHLKLTQCTQEDLNFSPPSSSRENAYPLYYNISASNSEKEEFRRPIFQSHKRSKAENLGRSIIDALVSYVLCSTYTSLVGVVAAAAVMGLLI